MGDAPSQATVREVATALRAYVEYQRELGVLGFAPAPPAASAAAVDAPAPSTAVPLAEPAPPASAPPPAAAAVPPAAAPTPATVEVVKPAPRPVKPRRVPKREAPDDWKKGIGIFGGG